MQNFLIFDENKSIMEKQLISSSEKIRQANEVQVTLSFHQKLHRAKLAIGKVSKNATSHHSKYANLNAIIEAVEPILLENGLLLLQPIQGNSVCTQIIDIDSGTMVESCMELPAGLNPQQQGSAITYYRRYTLQSTLSLQSVDDDGVAASKSTPTKPPISDERLTDALAAIKLGTYSPEKLREQFSLTKEQEAKL
jgi:hypothetical protein